jgi:hypothetical protein
MGHTSRCAYKNFLVQLKHLPFSRLAAISVAVKRRSQGVAVAAPCWTVSAGEAGRANTLAVGTGRPVYSQKVVRARESPVIAKRCSYARASAMASWSMAGCSNSTSIFRGLRRPNLLLLAEASATVDERQESILIIGDRRVPLQLDELP